ncbi:hypothetical protein B0A49_03037 [Cryomyces minteri]|uniref:Uncharacterized protein n=1 Tax=Cryomyces minteri TaxID=331657 RepID=A0A4U0XC21_9PEZI|nr:hypothetical protein B0A49_03037 [Cryomyces minteri]
MGKEFFNGWALWEKMTFVLGCAIVVTIAAGCLKLWYSHWKVRKYTAMAAEKKAQAQATPMVEAQAKAEQDDVEIPFGIRAIESGIEADGVWISRSNTPAASAAGSPTSSVFNQSATRSSTTDIPRLEMPQPTYGSAGNSRSSSGALSAAFDRAVSAEPLSSRPSSPNDAPPVASRRHPPLSFSRYSNSAIMRYSANLNILESHDNNGVEPWQSRKDQTRRSLGDRSSSTSRTSSGEVNEVPSSPDYLSPQPRVWENRGDLDLLQSHRMSHVAETGQLTPRVRRPGHSGEWASIATMKTPSENADYSITPHSPLSAVDPPSPNPFATPTSDFVSSSTPDSHPATTADQAKPLLETYQPQQTLLEDEPSSPVEMADQRRESQIMRKVNSGFEILKPGSLDSVRLDSNPRLSGVDGVAEKRISRRLQKKRRPSVESGRSSVDARRMSTFAE